MQNNLVGKSLVLAVIVLFIGANIIPSLVGVTIKTIPDYVYVDDDFDENTSGWGYDHFDKIQDGVDAVNESGTVYVYNGTYYETVKVKKSINLIGEDRNSTIIVGNHSQGVIAVYYIEGMTICGFTIKNGIDIGIAIFYSSSNIIKNNIFISSHGALIAFGISNSSILYNIMTSYESSGIYLFDSFNNNIIGNSIENKTSRGIYIGTSENDKVSTNVIKNCGMGMELRRNSNNSFSCNHIINTSKYGIILANSSKNKFYNNIFSDNNNGIHISHSNFSENNTFYHNDFISNGYDSYDPQTNIWDDGYPSGGNYWDDYAGEDNDGDGIGDTPYNISGGDNQDRYPLMELWNLKRPVANFSYTVEESPVMFDGSSSYDPDGYIVSYDWDFGDGTTGTGETVYHKYCEVGTYYVTLIITDDDGLTGTITKCVDVLVANFLPSLEINGPNKGKPGIEYEFDFIVSDPDDDEIYIMVDWGDGTYEAWIGPYGSGDPVKISHAWAEKGIYIIKAKVKDDCGESEWAEFQIEIPRNRVIVNLLLLWLLERFPIFERLLLLIT